MFHRFLGGFTTGTHQHDDVFGIRRTVVVEQFIFTASLLAKFIHDLLHDVGAGGVKAVGRLATLKKRVGILRGAAQNRLIRRHGAGANFRDDFVIDQRAQNGLIQHFNLGNFVRRAEAIEEMDERQPRTERGRL